MDTRGNSFGFISGTQAIKTAIDFLGIIRKVFCRHPDVEVYDIFFSKIIFCSIDGFVGEFWSILQEGESSSYFKLNRTAHCFGYAFRSEEHTSELQSRENLVCRLLLEKKNKERRNTLECSPR